MKDARYGRIKMILLAALAVFALFYFNVMKPVFEAGIAEARTERIAAERDSEDIEEIKNSPETFKQKIDAAEAEVALYDERVGLDPGAARIYIVEKAAAAGIEEKDISVTEGEEMLFASAIAERAYTVVTRAEYDKGLLFMREIEGESASWSVISFAYDDKDGGGWTIGLTLRYAKETG
jgi:hypothetical protein